MESSRPCPNTGIQDSNIHTNLLLGVSPILTVICTSPTFPLLFYVRNFFRPLPPLTAITPLKPPFTIDSYGIMADDVDLEAPESLSERVEF